MREVLLNTVGAIAITLVGLLGIAAALHILVTLPYPDNKGAEWVGAIGTVGTLIGTIWLASSAERRRRDEAIDRAVVTASALQLELFAVHHALQHAVEHFFNHIEHGEPIQYALLAENIAASANWSDAELLPLVVMREHVAARLVVASSIMRNSVKAMRDLEKTQSYSWAQEIKAKTDGTLLANLIRCRDTFAFALGECERLTKNAWA